MIRISTELADGLPDERVVDMSGFGNDPRDSWDRDRWDRYTWLMALRRLGPEGRARLRKDIEDGTLWGVPLEEALRLDPEVEKIKREALTRGEVLCAWHADGTPIFRPLA